MRRERMDHPDQGLEIWFSPRSLFLPCLQLLIWTGRRELRLWVAASLSLKAIGLTLEGAEWRCMTITSLSFFNWYIFRAGYFFSFFVPSSHKCSPPFSRSLLQWWTSHSGSQWSGQSSDCEAEQDERNERRGRTNDNGHERERERSSSSRKLISQIPLSTLCPSWYYLSTQSLLFPVSPSLMLYFASPFLLSLCEITAEIRSPCHEILSHAKAIRQSIRFPFFFVDLIRHCFAWVHQKR